MIFQVLRSVAENQNKIPEKEAAPTICLKQFKNPIQKTHFSTVVTSFFLSSHRGMLLCSVSFTLDGLVNYKCFSTLYTPVIMLTFTIPFTFSVDSPRTLKSRCDKSPHRTLFAGCRMKNYWRRSRHRKRSLFVWVVAVQLFSLSFG